MRKTSISVTVNGNKIQSPPGIRLSELISSELPCGGHGLCGKCRVLAKGRLSDLTEAERRHLSEQEILRGIRLACLTFALGDCEILTAPAESPAPVTLTGGRMPTHGLHPVFQRFGVAIDLGTTTLAARLYGRDGTLLAQAGTLNPQVTLGADVISRIEASLRGEGETLAQMVRDAINQLIQSLCRDAGINGDQIDAAVITGNTAMLYLLTNRSPLSLSRAPFLPDCLFDRELTPKELGISSLPDSARIYLPPCIAAFVGADTVCALLSTELCTSGTRQLLADVGTNGEIALWDRDRLWVCSTAAGPAFEGVGISCGMRGESGAIDRLSIVNGSLLPHTVDQTEPKGICGSGIVDAMACLRDLELMDPTGYLVEGDVPLSPGVTLTQQDVRAVQLAKGAIRAGIDTLLEVCGIQADRLSALILAGGFGSTLNLVNAARIGLLPPDSSGRTRAVGNAALSGASLLLLNGELRATAQALAKKAEVVELSQSPVFARHFPDAMSF